MVLFHRLILGLSVSFCAFGFSPTFAEEKSEEKTVEEQKASLPLKVILVDKEGKPVPETTVLVYDGNSYWAGQPLKFESQSKKTNAEGMAEFPEIPADNYRVQINARSPKYSGGYIYISRGKALRTDPLIQVKTTKELITATFKLRKHVKLDFTVHDDISGEVLEFLTIHFKDDRTDNWTLLSLVDAGGQHNFTTIIEEMSRAEYMTAKEGYYPAFFKLEKPLVIGSESRQFVPLKPAPMIQLTILTPDGKPAHGAKHQVLIPEGMEFGFSKNRKEADQEGKVLLPYPGAGELARIEVTHESGRAEFSVKDLPKPVTVGVDGEPTQLIEFQVRLKPKS